jgi:saccharopine dehydrogenase-like NADP-dependent oxidoreductase
MTVLCLGGAGRIRREAAFYLRPHRDVHRMTIADANRQTAEEVAKWIDDARVDAVEIDVRDTEATVALIEQEYSQCSRSATSSCTSGRSSSI